MFNLRSRRRVAESDMRQMLAMIRHRGPDEFGIYLDGPVGLGNARLSIIDLSTGQQPITNEDENLWIVFNGEIFNYLELRPELEARGHRFATASDTEVLLHAYEEFGPQCLERLNGQFAFAIWNRREQTLFLARDRLGVRPLFYTFSQGDLIFGSEIKAILADRRVRAEIDPAVLDQGLHLLEPAGPPNHFSRHRRNSARPLSAGPGRQSHCSELLAGQFCSGGGRPVAKKPGKLRSGTLAIAGGCRPGPPAGRRARGGLSKWRTGFLPHRLHHPQFHQQTGWTPFPLPLTTAISMRASASAGWRITWARNTR
jgi:asparagine synthetase B (glutamine-hydrolysing)